MKLYWREFESGGFQLLMEPAARLLTIRSLSCGRDNKYKCCCLSLEKLVEGDPADVKAAALIWLKEILQQIMVSLCVPLN